MTPEGERAVHRDAHVLGPLEDQGLGRQHVLDLGGADAHGEGAEGAVGRGVAVAADDGGAGLGQSLLGPDDMHDALADIVHRHVGDAEFGAVGLQRLDLDARVFFPDAGGAVGRGHVVIGHGEARLGAAQRSSRLAQALEGLGLVTSCTRWRSM